MNASVFRVLSAAEVAALSGSEPIKYMARLIEYVNGRIEDRHKSIAERERRLKSPDQKLVDQSNGEAD